MKQLQLTMAMVLLLAPIFVHAQVCSGSLGDPVVNMTFGSGPNPGAPLTAAGVTYSFTSGNCPPDGSYTIVNSTSGCFGNTWHSVSEDHTPNDTDGYMMLVNAAFNPDVFFVDTIRGLCAGTTYEFAAWVTNVLLPTSCNPTPRYPKLLFEIETVTGTKLGSYATADVPGNTTPTWTQYGLFFTTPLNTNSVVIRLTNTAEGGCGNDIALDDITFRPCGPTVNVKGNNTDSVNFDYCSGATATINLSGTIGNGYSLPALQWQESTDNGSSWKDIPGAMASTYTVQKTTIGKYLYRLAVADGSNIGISSCRIVSKIVTLTIHDLPTVSAGNNGPVCENSPVTLTAAGGVAYSWQGPDNFTGNTGIINLTTTNLSAGNYLVTGTDQFGCRNAASTQVIVNPKPVATISSDVAICEGEQVQLTATGGNTYTWSPATGLNATSTATVTAQPADSTTYSVDIANNINCKVTETVTVNVYRRPVANAGPDRLVIRGNSVVLQGNATGTFISVSWTPTATLDRFDQAQPAARPQADMRYTMQVMSQVGCGMSTDEVFVKVYNGLYIPKAFTPNGDGLNDSWRIEALAVYPQARTLIYNRFGQLVFEGRGAEGFWDGTYKGTELPIGAYTYLIDLQEEAIQVLKGTVLIIR